MPLLIHGEVSDLDVDIFDREECFSSVIFSRCPGGGFPGLRWCFGAHPPPPMPWPFVAGRRAPKLAATITPITLQINRNAMFQGGAPHAYCLPVAKTELHRLALRWAATSATRNFFSAPDSAPHPRSARNRPVGCAASSMPPHALEAMRRF